MRILFSINTLQTKLLTLVVLAGLSACDIPPIAVGTWNVEIGDAPNAASEVWTISETEQITLERSGRSETTTVELAGSRVSWTLGSMGQDATDRINFSGTVDGNELNGTVFSQQGNRSVTGTRR